MKKIILFLLGFLGFLNLQAQAPLIPSVRCSLTTVTVFTDPYTVTGKTSDFSSNWQASDIAAGDSLYLLDGSELRIYRVVSISSASGVDFTIIIDDINNSGNVPVTGEYGALFRGTTNYDFPNVTSGISETLQMAIQNRFVQRLDALIAAAGGIDSTTTSNDSVFVWSGGTAYFTGIAAGGGDNLDQAYNNFGANPSTITVDAAQGQTGGLEIESSGTNNITIDLQGTGDFIVQDGGTDVFSINDNGNLNWGASSFITSTPMLHLNKSANNLYLGQYSTLPSVTGLHNIFSGKDHTLGAAIDNNNISGESNVVTTSSSNNNITGLRNAISGSRNIMWGRDNDFDNTIHFHNAIGGADNTASGAITNSIITSSASTYGGSVNFSLFGGSTNTITGLNNGAFVFCNTSTVDSLQYGIVSGVGLIAKGQGISYFGRYNAQPPVINNIVVYDENDPLFVIGKGKGTSVRENALLMDGAGRIRFDAGTVVSTAWTNPTVSYEFVATDAMLIPSGTTAQRPTGQAGYIRYNSTKNCVESFNGANWGCTTPTYAEIITSSTVSARTVEFNVLNSSNETTTITIDMGNIPIGEIITITGFYDAGDVVNVTTSDASQIYNTNPSGDGTSIDVALLFSSGGSLSFTKRTSGGLKIN